MRDDSRIGVIVPALNEEESIAKVISNIPDWVDDIVVVDNGSIDRTTDMARSHGARVIEEYRRGYGYACLAGIKSLEEPDIVVFLDGDFSDHPEEMNLLVDPIVNDDADFVVGSRVTGHREPGAQPIQARIGNWLACNLIMLFWQYRYTDLGPFRAIRNSALKKLKMQDHNYGWTVEMQIKAASQGLRIREVGVSYRKRIGESKISGTIRGTVAAGSKILLTIIRFAIMGL
jgi:glycosyltransferase involved in cell wall biosynthesis